MCGIYGDIRFANDAVVDRASVESATRLLAHRGPDDEGFYLAGPVGLGFRRLSIIDLSAGHQPMSDAARRVWVVFNGEIYNFMELRAQLAAKGHVFRTRTDTEVIVYGYLEWGEQCLDKLRGMFGLAIWDTRARKLIVARDAMGIKPLYYQEDSHGVRFSSEVRPLLAGSGGPPAIDPTSLNLFLRHRYTPSPRTLFAGVRKLAPGTMLVVEAGRASVQRWYRFTPSLLPLRRLDDVAHELIHLYRTAVWRHLISDVPVGLLLSGGIDSALLLALMSEGERQWNTYTVGYGSSFADDELADARRTAAAFKSRHVELTLSRDQFEAALPKVVHSLEEPVAASSIVPMYLVCQRARQDVKVVLVGQGPDELFGGYTRHLGVHYGHLLRLLPAALLPVLRDAVGLLPRSAALKRATHALGSANRLTRYRDVLAIAPAHVIDGLFQDGTLPVGAAAAACDSWSTLAQEANGSDELGGFQWLELQSTLPDELLMYTDKMSMAHGLEARVPYLDRSVVEFGQSLSASVKIRFGTRKVVHRHVCARLLPAETLKRKKRGFAANVVDDWFRQSLGARMDATLRDESSLIYRLLAPRAVQRLLREHVSRRADNHKLLFSLVVLEEWMRVNGGSSTTRPVAAIA